MKLSNIAAVVLATAAVSGCSVLPDYSGAEYEHVSHPMAGWPFGPPDEEDTLDIANAYVGWHAGKRGYVEVTTGYKMRDGGFYGPEWTGGIRVGVKIHGQR